jgi:hypothetical protein
MADELFRNWTDASLDGVYARLASAIDVFEGLAIQFYLVMNECMGVKSKLIDELKLEDFLKLAEVYYKEKYQDLHKHYIVIGKKVPPIDIPTKGSVLNECFDNHPKRSDYSRISQQIRTLRNAIVHDVRVGMLQDKDGNILIPKPTVVSQYRQWSKVQAVAGDHNRIERDFCEVKTQCKSDIQRLKHVINALYVFMLGKFQTEFYLHERSALRAVFGIQFNNDGGGELPVALPEPQPHKSASFETTYLGTSGASSVSGTYGVGQSYVLKNKDL